MPRRTKSQWQALIEQQSTSGLSAAEFCRRNEVNAKYFSLRKKQLSQSNASSSQFIQITSPVTDHAHSSHSIKLRVTEVELPMHLDTQSDILPLLLDKLLR